MVAPIIAAALAPVVADLFKNGLTMLGSAVQAKGKKVIEEKLGVDLENVASTPEGMLKLRELELEYQEFLISASIEKEEIDLKRQELSQKDTASAREMNIRINESGNASWLSKNIAAIIASIIVIAGLFILYSTPHESVRIVTVGMLTTVLGFYFGSTSSSKLKDDTIRAMTDASK